MRNLIECMIAPWLLDILAKLQATTAHLVALYGMVNHDMSCRILLIHGSPSSRLFGFAICIVRIAQVQVTAEISQVVLGTCFGSGFQICRYNMYIRRLPESSLSLWFAFALGMLKLCIGKPTRNQLGKTCVYNNHIYIYICMSMHMHNIISFHTPPWPPWSPPSGRLVQCQTSLPKSEHANYV